MAEVWGSLKLEYLSILIVFGAWMILNELVYYLGLIKVVGFGFAVIFAYIRYFGVRASVVVVCIIQPVWLLVGCGTAFLAVRPVILCLFCIMAALLPLFVAGFILLFGKRIMDRREYKREHEGKGMYSVDPFDYKLAGDFKKELEDRGLYFTEEYRPLLMEINGRYQDFGKGVYGFFFFPPADITTLRSEQYKDDEYVNLAIHPDSQTRAPAYLYNVLLFRKEGSNQLRYLPFSYRQHQRYPQKNDPIKTEFFIVCRIAYVDGDLYAIIGVGESQVIREHFGMFSRPYYMILSEKENITTYFEGKYFPYGAIHVDTNGFTMQPNTREESHGYPLKPVNYPVRVVKRLDVDTINQVAAELMAGVLKEVGTLNLLGHL